MSKRTLRTIGIVLMALFLFVGTSVLAAPYGSRTMVKGTFGGDVVELQRRLGDLGYSVGVADGIFGSRTRVALLGFQRDYGLVPDGLAGKWTIQAVDRAYTWKHGFSYSVVSGDSLWVIANKAGTKVDSIIWLNRLQDSMLYPGQVLRIPGDATKRAALLAATAPAKPPVQTAPVQPAPKPTLPTATQPPAPTAPAPSAPAPTTPAAPPEAPVGTTPPVGTDPVVVPSQQQPAPVGTNVPTGKDYMVLGYYAEDWQGDLRSLDSLKNSQDQVDLAVNFALSINAEGKITTRGYPELLAEAQRQGVEVQGLVHNLTSTGFDSGVARAVLSNPAVRATAIQNLVAAAKEHSLAGINVDIENVPPDQRPNYTAFVKELSEALKPQGLKLTLSIPAKTWDDTKSSWSGAFDYKALGQYADHIVPMAYDENLPGFQAGPVASYNWVDKVAAFAGSQIPKEKVLLGIASYAYDWKKGTTEGRGLSVPQAMNLALKYGAQVQWDEVGQVPYFTYVNSGLERIVYFENARSTEAKLGLVKKHGLAGIAVWRMGLEDPAIWSVIQEKLN